VDIIFSLDWVSLSDLIDIDIDIDWSMLPNWTLH